MCLDSPSPQDGGISQALAVTLMSIILQATEKRLQQLREQAAKVSAKVVEAEAKV
jgi:hypothetical protein